MNCNLISYYIIVNVHMLVCFGMNNRHYLSNSSLRSVYIRLRKVRQNLTLMSFNDISMTYARPVFLQRSCFLCTCVTLPLRFLRCSETAVLTATKRAMLTRLPRRAMVPSVTTAEEARSPSTSSSTASSKASIKSHTKSRSGCLTCK